MSDLLLKGNIVAEKIQISVRQKVDELSQENIIPKLAIIRVGNKADDIWYQNSILKKCKGMGISAHIYEFEDNISNSEFINTFNLINSNEEIDGILLLRPIPSHLDEEYIKENIDQRKDIDGIGYKNMAKLYANSNIYIPPCTSDAVIEILDYYGINVSGKRIVVLGRSLVIGRPLSLQLLHKNATVVLCHSKTNDIKELCKSSDIIVSCIGKAKFLNEEYVLPNSIVIDVGINEDENGNLCGDVDFALVSEVVQSITPVPGGIGLITSTILCRNVVNSCLTRKESK